MRPRGSSTLSGATTLLIGSPVLLALCGFLLAQGPSPAPAASAALRPSTLRIGMPRQAFANLNETDAEAAYRAFVIATGRKRGYELEPQLRVFDSLAALEAAVRSGTVNVISVSTWQLLETRLPEQVELAFVPATNGNATRRLLLLARGDSGINTLSDLRGRSLLILRDTRVNLAQAWIETECLAAGAGRPESFFGRVEIVTRANTTVLPVFFGRTDACVVDEESFGVVCELNPQLRVKLKVVAESPPLLDSVVCLNRIGWLAENYRDDLRRSLGELHLEPSGRQILTLFRIDQLLPFDPAMLATITELHARHARLEREFARPTAASAAATGNPTPR